MVWEQRKARAMRRGKPIDWVVMRSRLSSLDAKNKRDIGQLLQQLAKRIGFRVAPGFTERVIFRELFPRGLTLLDLSRNDTGVSWRMSHVAARQEVRDLIDALALKPPATEDSGRRADAMPANPPVSAAPIPAPVTPPAPQTSFFTAPTRQAPVRQDERQEKSEKSDLPLIRFSR
jgi:hypothetical protein